MKQIYSFLFIWMIGLSAWAQSGKDYNPENPADPTMYYFLTMEAAPRTGGSVGRSRVAAAVGQTVYCEATAKVGYAFKHWMIGDSLVSTNRYFSYTMPAHDVVMVAYFEYTGYNPESPGDPFIDGYKHNVTLYATPSVGGYFNSASFVLTEGEVSRIYAYPRNGYRFESWMQGNKVVSTDNPLTIRMGTQDVEYKAVFAYNPENPGDPSANFFNRETGEVVIDNFSSGNLNSALSHTIGGGDYRSEVKSITVVGVLSPSDFGFAYWCANCEVIDLSRTTGYNEVPSYAFEGASALKTIYLPTNVDNIGEYAFVGCNNLKELYIYSPVPPVLGRNSFYGVPSDMVVYVPSAAVELYRAADRWNLQSIKPLDGEEYSFTVNFPSNVSMGEYKNMTLELVNVQSGQIYKYLVTDRHSYTFYALMKNTMYNVFLKNVLGEVIAELSSVMLEEKDINVSFESVKRMYDVALTVQTPEGDDVTSMVDITWYDEQGSYLKKGNVINSVVEGRTLQYRINIDDDLAMEYVQPLEKGICVASENGVIHTLSRLEKVEFVGRVVDANSKRGIRNASVSLSQTVNKTNNKTQVVKTDDKGYYSITAYNAPYKLAVSAYDYVTQAKMVDTPSVVDGKVGVGDIMLASIIGATINISHTYVESAEEGVTPEIMNWYKDYDNIAYEVYNVTIAKDIAQVSYRYPQLVLLDDAKIGDSLRITATSKKEAFMPVVVGATIDSTNVVDAIFDIKQLGQIKATYKTTENPSVVGILYSSDGQFLKKYPYNQAELKINEFKDGTYYLVTMGKNERYNSPYNISRLLALGLMEDVDYIKEEIVVESGLISTVSCDEVPFFDENKFNYIEMGNSSLYASQSSIVVGNYVTLVGSLDVIGDLEELSELKFMVDLPSTAAFVEGSVMIGETVTSNYTFEGGTLTIPLNGYKKGDKIKFCVIPTEEGEYAPNALVSFYANDREAILPIGSSFYTVEALTINVPSVTASKTVIVDGVVAEPKSVVEVYDNDVIIANVTPLANGSWTAKCDLNEAYNLSIHNIHAKITTDEGVRYESEAMACEYDKNAIVVDKVTMYHNGYKRNVFDFIHHTSQAISYAYSSNPTYTFTLEFNHNDTTKISNVVLHIKTMEGEWIPLYPQYDLKQGFWVVSVKSSGLGYSHPVNVSVDFDSQTMDMVDRNLLNSEIDEGSISWYSLQEDAASLFDMLDQDVNVDSIGLAIETILSDDTIDMYYLGEMLNCYVSPVSYSNQMSIDYDSLVNEYDAWLDMFNKTGFLSTLEDFYIPTDTSSVFSFDDIKSVNEVNGKANVYEMKNVEFVNEDSLVSLGFDFYLITDSTKVYYLYNDSVMIYVDVARKEEYSFRISELYNNIHYIRARISDYKSFADCAEAIGMIVADLKNLKEGQNSNSKELAFVLTKSLSDLMSAVECFYSGARVELEDRIKSCYSSNKSEIERRINEHKVLENQLHAEVDNDIKWQESLKEKNTILDKKNKELYDLIDNGGLTELELRKIRDEITINEEEFRLNSQAIGSLEERIVNKSRQILTEGARINRLEMSKMAIKQAYDLAMDNLRKLPLSTINGVKVNKALSITSKLAGPFGTLVDVVCFGCDVYDLYVETQGWLDLISAMERKLPCEGDEERAQSLNKRIQTDLLGLVSWGGSIIIAEGNAIGADLSTIFAPEIALPLWFVSGALNIYAEWTKLLKIERYYLPKRGDYWKEWGELKCNIPSNKGGKHKPNNPDMKPYANIDPAGYVYEGVSSNRVEGVMASCYYKETEEDEYGIIQDRAVLWDATEFEQENPLFTDEKGKYQWFVPQGLWQVKFEKEGYETTYSEWLPVPPPQLEVNVPIVQNKQPEVKSVHAYEDGIVVEFDKYMQPATLNTNNIFVVQNGEKVAGTVTMLNEEIAYRDENVTYASKVRFVYDQPITTEEVTLTVSNQVKSYAGVQMQEAYTQTFDIEKEIKQLVAEETVSVYYGNEHTLTVKAQPAEAAAGKTLMVASLSPMILTVDAESVVFDENGEAVVKVYGELPGTTAVNYSIAGYDCKASTVVEVIYEDVNVTANPTASIASGTTVEKGAEVTLHCVTEGAVIYYTLDGSCPCDVDALTYDGTPIVINEDTELRIMAVAEGRSESDVVVYHYYVKNDGGSSEPVEVTIYKKWNDVLICDNSANEFVAYQWYKNGMPIDGETNQYYSEAEGLNGSYYVMAQRTDGEWGVSNIIICEKREGGGLKVTPTIVKRNEKCVVSVDRSGSEEEMVSLNVFNTMGQIVKKMALSSEHSVEMEFEHSGAYFIKAIGLKENVESEKVIVIE